MVPPFDGFVMLKRLVRAIMLPVTRISCGGGNSPVVWLTKLLMFETDIVIRGIDEVRSMDAAVTLKPAVFVTSDAPILAKLLLLLFRFRTFSALTHASAVATDVVVSPIAVISVPLK